MLKLEVSNAKPMSFELLCKIWDSQQAQKAKRNYETNPRMPRKLTRYQQYDKYAKLGHALKYKGVRFVYTDGIGELIKADGSGVWNATISDFIHEVRKSYGKVFAWAVDHYNDHT